ncbi:MAG: STAS domain-containing protein [Clostridia bacterium]|nr:STAS domain-containing protein [Clostridia bacterium]
MSAIIDGNSERMTVWLDGEIDHHNAGGIRVRIDETLIRLRPKLLSLDFSAVTFMDSSGIGLIMGRYKNIQSWSGKLEVINVPRSMSKVMRLAGLERIATIRNMEEIK